MLEQTGRGKLKPRKARIILTAVFCCVLVLFTNAEGLAEAKSKHHNVQTLTKTFTFSPEDIGFYKDGVYDRLKLKGGTANQDNLGYPEIPEKHVNILLPCGAEVIGLSAIATESLLAENIYLYPIQPPRAVSSKEPPKWVEPVTEVYASTKILPGDFAFLTSGTQKMRGWRFAEVKLCPLRYLPAKRQLYLASEIAVTIEFVISEKLPLAPKRGHKLFERTVKKIVVNPDQAGAAPVISSVGNLGNPEGRSLKVAETSEAVAMTAPLLAEEIVDYLIITSQDMVSVFQPLADHRAFFNSWGTQIVTTEYIDSNYSGDDIQMKIRNCIIDYVNNYGTIFVVLGGDDTKVPDRDCYIWLPGDASAVTDLPTDMYYAGLDGTWDHWDNDGVYGEVDVNGNLTHDEFDKYAEVYVGRIPVRTTGQVTAYINKVIDYDWNVDEHLIHKILLGGYKAWDRYEGDDRPNSSVCDGHIGFSYPYHPIVSDAEIEGREDYRDQICANNWPVSEVKLLYDTLNSWNNDGSGGPTQVYSAPASSIVDWLSEGWHIVHHFSHGGTSGLDIGGWFGYYNADDLYGPVNFWHTGSCLTGGFDIREPCFSEALLRNPNGGCLVYMGNSRLNWGGIAQDLNEEFLRLIAEEGLSNIGEIFYEHKLIARMDNPWERWTFYVMNLQGDPALYVIPSVYIVNVEAEDAVASEPGDDVATFVISRAPTTGELTVSFELDGMAQLGPDNDYVTVPDGGIVTIPDGSDSAAVTIVAVDESDIEGDKTVVLTLLGNEDYLVGNSSSATVMLLDDDPMGNFAGNECIDGLDLVCIVNNWLAEGEDMPEDLYQDQIIDFKDFALFAGNWLSCAPPAITIVNPPDGAVIPYSVGVIEIEADVVSNGYTVAKVEFFANEGKIGEDNNADDGWSFDWYDYDYGDYNLIAMVWDDSGRMGASLPVAIEVVDAPPP